MPISLSPRPPPLPDKDFAPPSNHTPMALRPFGMIQDAGTVREATRRHSQRSSLNARAREAYYLIPARLDNKDKPEPPPPVHDLGVRHLISDTDLLERGCFRERELPQTSRPPLLDDDVPTLWDKHRSTGLPGPNSPAPHPTAQASRTPVVLPIHAANPYAMPEDRLRCMGYPFPLPPQPRTQGPPVDVYPRYAVMGTNPPRLLPAINRAYLPPRAPSPLPAPAEANLPTEEFSSESTEKAVDLIVVRQTAPPPRLHQRGPVRPPKLSDLATATITRPALENDTDSNQRYSAELSRQYQSRLPELPPHPRTLDCSPSASGIAIFRMILFLPPSMPGSLPIYLTYLSRRDFWPNPKELRPLFGHLSGLPSWEVCEEVVESLTGVTPTATVVWRDMRTGRLVNLHDRPYSGQFIYELSPATTPCRAAIIEARNRQRAAKFTLPPLPEEEQAPPVPPPPARIHADAHRHEDQYDWCYRVPGRIVAVGS